MEFSSPEDEDAGLLGRRRNARSLDIGTSSTREPSKAAAWLWHMHNSSPTSKKGEDMSPDQYATMWKSKRRSASIDRKDSRFRQEAWASASASVSTDPLSNRPVTSTPSKAPDSRIWDCDSKLYDTFELVSFSDRLDRSLLGVPAFDVPKSHPTAVQSIVPYSSFDGAPPRTFSLPRTLSLHNLLPATPPQNVDGNSVEPSDVNVHRASPADLQGNQSVPGAPPPPAIEPKLSALRRAFSTKWNLSKLVKMMKKMVNFHKQMQCFQTDVGQDKATVGRGIDIIANEDVGGVMAPEHRQIERRASGDKIDVGERSEVVGEEVEGDGVPPENPFRVYEEKVNEGRAGQHFHHHHHHYHHHFVHRID